MIINYGLALQVSVMRPSLSTPYLNMDGQELASSWSDPEIRYLLKTAFSGIMNIITGTHILVTI